MPNGLIHTLIQAWESNPLRFSAKQNRFGTLLPGVSAKVASRNRPVHESVHALVGNSGRLWQDPVTGKAQAIQPAGTPGVSPGTQGQLGQPGEPNPRPGRRYLHPPACTCRLPTPGTYPLPCSAVSPCRSAVHPPGTSVRLSICRFWARATRVRLN